VHAHKAQFYKDTGSRLFWVDLDDLPVPIGLGRADRFAEGVAYVVSLLPEAFRDAARIAFRTTSTGSHPDHFSGRIAFVLSAPLKLDAMRALAEGIAALTGFEVTAEEREKREAEGLRAEVIDLGIYTLGKFLFIAPPECEDGVLDPGAPASDIWIVDAEPLDPVEAAKALGVDLQAARPARSVRRTLEHGAGADLYAGRVLDVPEPERFLLILALVRALPNKLDRNGWIGAGIAIEGACGGADYGFEIFDEFSQRWEDGADDPGENRRVWDTLPANGENGINYLTGWAIKLDTPEAVAAVDAIEQARSAATARKFPDDEHAGEEDDNEGADKGDPAWLREMNARYSFVHDRPGAVLDLHGTDTAVTGAEALRVPQPPRQPIHSGGQGGKERHPVKSLVGAPAQARI
jgi:hypothetical protein